MTTDNNILLRKIEIAAEDCASASFQEALVKDISHKLAKVILETMSIEVMVEVQTSSIRSPSRIIDVMNTILFGHIHLDEELGVAGFDAAIIEFFAGNLSGIGVVGTEAESERSPTNTDAALCSYILSKVLGAVFNDSESFGNTIPKHFMKGFGLGKAPLIYQLQQDKYAYLPVAIRTPDGGVIGNIELVFPLLSLKPFCGNRNALPDAGKKEVWQRHMSKIVNETPLKLISVMQKIQMPLGEVLSLGLGDFLEFSNVALDEVSLSARTAQGDISVFSGRLGTLKSNKAVCLSRIE